MIKLSFFSQLLNWIYPNYCLLCQSQSNHEQMICDACLPQLPWKTNSCYQCGILLENITDASDASNTSDILNTKKICGVCLKNHYSFDQTIALWQYEAPINKYITQLKFNSQLRYAKLLGSLFADYLEKNRSPKNFPQCLIPMPLHSKRLRQRGFNQAMEIARFIAKRLNIPLNANLCLRQKNTLPQIKLSAPQRLRNLHQAFYLRKTKSPPSLTHVAIVDDVMTTSASVNELSKTLKQHGIKKVEVWCCARATLRNI